MHILAHNLIRTIMAQAAARHDVVQRSISFKGSLQTLDAFQPLIKFRADRGMAYRLQIYQHLLDTIVTHRVADRPNRYEPRLQITDAITNYDNGSLRSKRRRWESNSNPSPPNLEAVIDLHSSTPHLSVNGQCETATGCHCLSHDSRLHSLILLWPALAENVKVKVEALYLQPASRDILSSAECPAKGDGRCGQQAS